MKIYGGGRLSDTCQLEDEAGDFLPIDRLALRIALSQILNFYIFSSCLGIQGRRFPGQWGLVDWWSLRGVDLSVWILLVWRVWFNLDWVFQWWCWMRGSDHDRHFCWGCRDWVWSMISYPFRLWNSWIRVIVWLDDCFWHTRILWKGYYIFLLDHFVPMNRSLVIAVGICVAKDDCILWMRIVLFWGHRGGR